MANADYKAFKKKIKAVETSLRKIDFRISETSPFSKRQRPLQEKRIDLASRLNTMKHLLWTGSLEEVRAFF